MSKKFVYLFAEGDENMRDLLGGKGANLAQMSKLGMPVPYGFTITTEACNQYYADGELAMSYTVARRHIRLARFTLKKYL